MELAEHVSYHGRTCIEIVCDSRNDHTDDKRVTLMIS